jgi:hypothetical protein
MDPDASLVVVKLAQRDKKVIDTGVVMTNERL